MISKIKDWCALNLDKCTIFSLLIFLSFIGCHRVTNLNASKSNLAGPTMIHLKYFGLVDCSDDPTTMWQKRVTIDDQKFYLELNYPKHADKKSLLLMNQPSLEALEDIVRKSRKSLKRNFKKNGIVHEFIVSKFEKFKHEDYEFYEIDQKQSSHKNEVILLDAIELSQVGIFLVDSENHLCLNYRLPKKDNTAQNELFVKYNRDFELKEISYDKY